jgi:uncharacterized surface protein with fasciclin (FAS1) repeats
MDEQGLLFQSAVRSCESNPHGRAVEQLDIVEVAIAAGRFKTLVVALMAAGLVDTLTADGPHTFFAPTDEAFVKLGKDKISELLRREKKAALVAILKCHVVAGRMSARDAVAAGSAISLQGQRLVIKAGGGLATVNDARIVTSDLDAANGVIHAIDSVILPTLAALPAGKLPAAASRRDSHA